MSDTEIDDLPDETANWGPAFGKLNEKQRKFVLALLELPDTPGVLTEAARRAGYGSATSSKQCMYAIASQVWTRPRVQNAFYECGRMYLGTLGLRALKGAAAILDEGPKHKDFYKMVKACLGYVWPQETTHNVNVVHEEKMSEREFLELAPKCAEQWGIPVERLIGYSRHQTIEGQAVRLPDQSAADNSETEDGEHDGD